MGHQWDFGSVAEHWPLLAKGLQGTLQLAIVCIVAAAIIGLVVGSGRYSVNPAFRWPATAFVEVFRNTPVLVSLIWFYFAFPILSGVRMNVFTAAAVAISLNGGAFAAEIFRAGMQSIARGQWDASRAIGTSHQQMMRRVILPQAIKRMLPAVTNRAIEILKTTSIASIIAYFELLHSARTIASSYFNPIEAFTVVALLFLCIVYPLSLAASGAERVLRRSE